MKPLEKIVIFATLTVIFQIMIFCSLFLLWFILWDIQPINWMTWRILSVISFFISLAVLT